MFEQFLEGSTDPGQYNNHPPSERTNPSEALVASDLNSAMVQKDAVLAGYKERIERAMEEDCNKWKVYLGKQQAHVEWEKVVEEQKGRCLEEEETRRIMVAFFQGRDLVYCERNCS